MRVVARQRQSGRRGSKGAGLCVGSGARGGGARGCSCDSGPRGSHRCSVAAGAEGLESSLGVASLRGAGAAVPPELGPSTPGGSGPLGEGLAPLCLPSPFHVDGGEVGGARERKAPDCLPCTQLFLVGFSGRTHGHLRHRLLSPAKTTPGGGRGRCSPAGAESRRATTGTIGE